MSYMIMLCIRFIYSKCYAMKQTQTNTASTIKFLIVLFNYTYIGGGFSSSSSNAHVRCWFINKRNVYHHIIFPERTFNWLITFCPVAVDIGWIHRFPRSTVERRRMMRNTPFRSNLFCKLKMPHSGLEIGIGRWLRSKMGRKSQKRFERVLVTLTESAPFKNAVRAKCKNRLVKIAKSPFSKQTKEISLSVWTPERRVKKHEKSKQHQNSILWH